MINIQNAFKESHQALLKSPQVWLVPLIGWYAAKGILHQTLTAPQGLRFLVLIGLLLFQLVLIVANIMIALAALRGESLMNFETFGWDKRHLNSLRALFIMLIPMVVVAFILNFILRSLQFNDSSQLQSLLLSAAAAAVASRLSFALPLIVDKNEAAVEAIRRSWALTQGLTWPIAAVFAAFSVAFSLDAKIYSLASVYLLPIFALMGCHIYEQLILNEYREKIGVTLEQP